MNFCVDSLRHLVLDVQDNLKITFPWMNSIHSSSRANIGTKESLVTDNAGIFSFYPRNTWGNFKTLSTQQHTDLTNLVQLIKV